MGRCSSIILLIYEVYFPHESTDTFGYELSGPLKHHTPHGAFDGQMVVLCLQSCCSAIAPTSVLQVMLPQLWTSGDTSNPARHPSAWQNGCRSHNLFMVGRISICCAPAPGDTELSPGADGFGSAFTPGFWRGQFLMEPAARRLVILLLRGEPIANTFIQKKKIIRYIRRGLHAESGLSPRAF